MSGAQTVQLRDEINALHPALAGHFPGNPIVPGVVILQRVCRAVMQVHGCLVTAVPLVKFHAPLLPEEVFDIGLERVRESAVNFRVLRGNTLIAAGTVHVGIASA